MPAGTPAASLAPRASVSGPCPYRLVSTCWLIAGAAHWCHVETSWPEVLVSISCPLSVAESEHTPEGESADTTNGHVPLIQLPVCHSPLGALKPGPLVSRTYSENAPIAIWAG